MWTSGHDALPSRIPCRQDLHVHACKLTTLLTTSRQSLRLANKPVQRISSCSMRNQPSLCHNCPTLCAFYYNYMLLQCMFGRPSLMCHGDFSYRWSCNTFASHNADYLEGGLCNTVCAMVANFGSQTTQIWLVAVGCVFLSQTFTRQRRAVFLSETAGDATTIKARRCGHGIREGRSGKGQHRSHRGLQGRCRANRAAYPYHPRPEGSAAQAMPLAAVKTTFGRCQIPFCRAAIR